MVAEDVMRLSILRNCTAVQSDYYIFSSTSVDYGRNQLGSHQIGHVVTTHYAHAVISDVSLLFLPYCLEENTEPLLWFCPVHHRSVSVAKGHQ